MHLHILGIGGTFMSALALLAKEAGFKVTGCDANCYPPVSDLLQAKGIEWIEGYEDSTLALKADQVIIGNAIKRGMPILEDLMNASKNYTSGPQWLQENLLSRYRVIAVSGTHGKTTTTTMLAFILQQAGLNPAFLIGGVAPNFETSAQLGQGKWFVIEADEYDSAFFDKRPKLMHFRPEIAILNNLEFDHADIYENLAAIKQQFHYYLKTIPAKGVIIKPRDDAVLNEVIERGLYCRMDNFACDGDATWRAELLDASGQSFCVWHQGKVVAEVNWPLIGQFNVENGLAALAASVHAGVDITSAAKALAEFKPAKRRLEIKSNRKGITVYDDFAHHPTAINKTIKALEQSGRHKKIFAVLEFASYTMKTGIHAPAMAEALATVNGAYFLNTDQFDLIKMAKDWRFPNQIFNTTTAIVEDLMKILQPGDAVLIMSNRSFGNIYQELISRIDQ